MSSFEDYMNSRKTPDQMIAKANEISSDGNQKDSRIWKPAVDKAGNGTALIRFIGPASVHGETDEFVRWFDHFFQGPTGQWYVEKSRTTLGDNEPDPASEYNRGLWSSGAEGQEFVKKKSKRKLHYWANIYVIEDELNPDAVGQVWIYDFGATIHEHLKTAMEPKFAHIKKINPFDMIDGADFRLIAQIGANRQRNYEASTFQPASPLLGGDMVKLKGVFDQMHAIEPAIDPASFKSYDALEKKLYEVMGEMSPSQKAAAALATESTSPDLFPTADATESGPTADPNALPQTGEVSEAVVDSTIPEFTAPSPEKSDPTDSAMFFKNMEADLEN